MPCRDFLPGTEEQIYYNIGSSGSVNKFLDGIFLKWFPSKAGRFRLCRKCELFRDMEKNYYFRED
jgi:hypothetical protein